MIAKWGDFFKRFATNHMFSIVSNKSGRYVWRFVHRVKNDVKLIDQYK